MVRVKRSQSSPNSGTASAGFTLLELMFVMTIILILASFALPTYTTMIQRAREAVLRDDLQTMRKLIDEYTIDKQQPPQELQDLVDAGYLRGGVPKDPMTGSSDTWKVDIEDVPSSPNQAESGIVDVHSGSDQTALNGTSYSSW
ncbi:MAG: type II secretion system protein [Acidobacteriota bacterium]|nr:type II secretion system protein [Acidobacteriota bacterium]